MPPKLTKRRRTGSPSQARSTPSVEHFNRAPEPETLPRRNPRRGCRQDSAVEIRDRREREREEEMDREAREWRTRMERWLDEVETPAMATAVSSVRTDAEEAEAHGAAARDSETITRGTGVGADIAAQARAGGQEAAAHGGAVAQTSIEISEKDAMLDVKPTKPTTDKQQDGAQSRMKVEDDGETRVKTEEGSEHSDGWRIKHEQDDGIKVKDEPD